VAGQVYYSHAVLFVWRSSRSLALFLVLLVAAGGCGRSQQAAATDAGAPKAAAQRPKPPRASGSLEERFEQYRRYYDGLSVAELEAELAPEPAEPKAAVDLGRARYYRELREAIDLAPAEIEMLRRQGVVGIDALPHESIGTLYQFIWTRDLPVLVTTDSVLHALFMSHELVLQDFEREIVAAELMRLLGTCRKTLGSLAARTPASDAATWTALRDVELVLTVAGSLLEGAGAQPGEATPETEFAEPPEFRPLKPPPARHFATARWQSPTEQEALLHKISDLVVETPQTRTSIRGGARPIDYGQFRVRGHYADYASTRRFFRAMTWLGRPDTGFIVQALDRATGIEVDVERELRASGVLAYVLASSGALVRWSPVEATLSDMVGPYDDVAVTELASALSEDGLYRWEDVRAPGFAKRVENVLATLGSDRSRVRAQTVASTGAGSPAPSPHAVELIPQRFLMDGYLSTTVTFDRIVARGKTVRRYLASGLDIMAMLGNDDAVRLLRPELELYPYAGNLRAARQLVADTDPGQQTDVPSRWLGALRTLGNRAPVGGRRPRAMQTKAYRYKQLRTELASWTERRHTLLLYGKQPSSAYETCVYPRAYVEPWPETFAALAALAQAMVSRFDALPVIGTLIPASSGRRAVPSAAALLRVRQRDFFVAFARICRRLEGLANKELLNEPFTDEDTDFLAHTIADTRIGSGPPRWDGWYAELFYKPMIMLPPWPDEDPSERAESASLAGQPAARLAPTVADVMTDPTGGLVLQAAVGAAELLVVAVEDAVGSPDTTLFVGPVFTYYEFTGPSDRRMTDDEWQKLVFAKRSFGDRSSRPAASPNFIDRFQAPPRVLAEDKRLARPRGRRWKSQH
jgi:hypothetical protein